MPGYVEMNALGADQPLPKFYWTGDTEMACLRDAIGQTLRLGYAHHIQRLMVTWLYALMLGVRPREVHEWYLAVYVDAVEWVEQPNMLGMSQHGDGDLMASKPYIATGKYIQRMSNYCAGCRFDPPARRRAPSPRSTGISSSSTSRCCGKISAWPCKCAISRDSTMRGATPFRNRRRRFERKTHWEHERACIHSDADPATGNARTPSFFRRWPATLERFAFSALEGRGARRAGHAAARALRRYFRGSRLPRHRAFFHGADSPGMAAAAAVAVWQPGGDLREAAPGSLEFFLVERYALFSTDRSGALHCGRVHHQLYQISHAVVPEFSVEPARQAGLDLASPPISTLCANAVEVSIFGLGRW